MNVQDSIRPKRLMVIVQSNGIIRREPDHYLIGRLAEDVSFSDLDKDIPIRTRESESRKPGAHTPGPWHYRDVVRCNGFSCYRFSNFSGSFEQWSADEDREANAQLISAAPDLLACLKMALANIEANGLNVPKVQGKIMQVINQAEGRNSNQCAASRPSCPEIPDKSMPICPIQPAEDPRKAMSEQEVLTRVQAMGEESLSPDNFEGLMRALEALKTTRNVDGGSDDPRKQMLKTLRQRLLLESSPVLNDAYEGRLYLSDVNAILEELEAKL